MKRLVVAIALLVLLPACFPAESGGPEIPAVGLSMDEAKKVTAAFEAKAAAKTADDPLRKPKSLDDVLEILKRDQIDLFAAGVKYADIPGDLKALTLRAQIELAWGEAQMILAETFNGATRSFKGTLADLEAKGATGAITDAEKDQLNELRKYVGETTATADALTKLASEHVALGAQLAREVIAKNPSDYHGYRVAADYYRLRQDWAAFDGMVKKIEETNPQSNGLVFLQGISAAQREGDVKKAIDMFKKSLERDAKFVRAQAHILLLQQTVPDIYAEFDKLKKLNPNHQIILWAGDYIQKAYDQWKQAHSVNVKSTAK